jgi:hypothetical protein
VNFRNKRFFFVTKKAWNRSPVLGPGPRWCVPQVHTVHKMETVHPAIYNLELKGRRTIWASNLIYSNRNQWLGWCLLTWLDSWWNRAPGTMAADGGGAKTWATECEMTQWFFQHDLEGKGVSFYSLSAEEMIHGGLAAAAQSSQSLTASHDLGQASSAPKSSSKALPWSPQASPRFNCFGWWRIKLVWGLSSCARVQGLGDKIHRARAAMYRSFYIES